MTAATNHSARRMNRAFFIILVAAFVAGHSFAAEEARLTPERLAGSYYRGDGMGYNIELDLRASGDYSAIWRGCLGIYGTATGRWELDGEVIRFTPTRETDMMKKHLRQLHLVRTKGDFVFVPDLKDDYYRKYGADKYSAFHKQPPDKATK